MKDKPVDWFSLENGEHVPIYEGQSKREAYRNYMKKKNSRVEKNKDKYDKINEFKEKKKSNNKIEDDEEIEYLDLDDDTFENKFIKKGDNFELKPELKEKLMKEYNLTDEEVKKNFNISKDGTKYIMKPEVEEKIRKKLRYDYHKKDK